MKVLKISIVVLILIVSGLISFLMFSNWQKETKDNVSEEISIINNETEDINGTVQMSLELGENAYIGETGNFDIVVNPKLYEIPGIDIVISYDSEYIQIESIEGDSDNIIHMAKDINSEEGIAMLSVITPVENMIDTKTTVATVNYVALKEGSVEIKLEKGDENAPQTYISLLSEDAVRAPLTLENLTLNITNKPEGNDSESGGELLMEE